LNLGESRHLLAEPVDLRFRLGCVLLSLGDRAGARAQWRAAADVEASAPEGTVRGETTFASAMAAARLGRGATARRWFEALLRHARELRRRPVNIDYFATSLPTLLLFDDDLKARQTVMSIFLEAQARIGLGQTARGRALLRDVLRRDPAHAGAMDLSRDVESGLFSILTAPRTGIGQAGKGRPGRRRRGRAVSADTRKVR
jgi:hypothetical protein